MIISISHGRTIDTFFGEFGFVIHFQKDQRLKDVADLIAQEYKEFAGTDEELGVREFGVRRRFLEGKYEHYDIGKDPVLLKVRCLMDYRLYRVIQESITKTGFIKFHQYMKRKYKI